MLTKVTITGADDQVMHEDLVKLSKEFPFVEWGILFSISREGTARYPTLPWIEKFLPLKQENDLQISVHLCGQASYGAYIAGYTQDINPFIGIADRIQINGFRANRAGGLLKLPDSFEYILQVPSADKLEETAKFTTNLLKASALFDPSGGKGLPATEWPKPPPNLKIGYAGGINIHNIDSVLDILSDRDYDFWIDMESGVRTDDRFDLDIVHQILNKIQSRSNIDLNHLLSRIGD